MLIVKEAEVVAEPDYCSKMEGGGIEGVAGAVGAKGERGVEGRARVRDRQCE